MLIFYSKKELDNNIFFPKKGFRASDLACVGLKPARSRLGFSSVDRDLNMSSLMSQLTRTTVVTRTTKIDTGSSWV